MLAAGTLLDSDALTIGFARRFTGYKRPDLIFRDPERLARILNTPGRPVQIVFAGKSHPADDTGKHRLQGVYRHALDPAFAGRVAFVEDYDLHVAHFLVQGCDVWLNNPRKPLEASGTSGMKASINGVPHFSIGDGWWAEALQRQRTAGSSTAAAAAMRRAVDDADAAALYRLLEEEIVPAFYDRGPDQVPHRWVQVVKEAIRTVTPQFSTRRMVKEYVQRMYCWPRQRRQQRCADQAPARYNRCNATQDRRESYAAPCAARRTCPSPAARRSTAGIAGTRRSRSRRSSPASSRSSATSARTRPRNT